MQGAWVSINNSCTVFAAVHVGIMENLDACSLSGLLCIILYVTANLENNWDELDMFWLCLSRSLVQ